MFGIKLLLLLAAAVTGTLAIKCYHCDSRTSITCKDNQFDKKENIIEHDEFGNECEYCTKSTFKMLGKNVIQRRCEIESFDLDRYDLDGRNDCTGSWFYHIEGEICVCNKKKCNSAGAVLISMVTLLTSLLISKLLV